MSEFDTKARDWDKDNMHLDRAQAIASKLKVMMPLKPSMTAMEYGAGTGLLGFILKKDLGQLTLVDTSSEMIEVSKEKIRESGISGMTALKIDILNENLNQKFDLIFNQMVLHHVSDTTAIISKFYELLNPGGTLAIADLYSEDGSFHGAGANVHLGFHPEELKQVMKKAGFTAMEHQTCYVVCKKVSETEIKDFPVFLLLGKK